MKSFLIISILIVLYSGYRMSQIEPNRPDYLYDISVHNLLGQQIRRVELSTSSDDYFFDHIEFNGIEILNSKIKSPYTGPITVKIYEKELNDLTYEVNLSMPLKNNKFIDDRIAVSIERTEIMIIWMD